MEELPNQPPDDPEKPGDDEEEEERGSALAEMFRNRREEQEDNSGEEEPDESWFGRDKEAAEAEPVELEAVDVEPVGEAEAPTETMSAETETPMVASTLAEHELKNIPEHSSEGPVDEEVAADLAAADFYERVEETGDIEAAEAATTEALEAAEPPEEPAAEAIPETPIDLAEEDMVNLRDEQEPFVAEDTAEDIPEAEPPEETEPGDPAQSPPTPPPQPANPIPVPPHGGANQPPVPPVPPHGGPGGPGGPAGPGFGGFNAPNFNTAPAAVPNLRPERIDDRASPAAMALFGGIVGYLIGRRRGRIKTEKKLLPIQKKLEKQVTDMHWEMKAKEAKIRQLAREKVRQTGPAAVETLAAAAVTRKADKAEKPAAEQKVKPIVITKVREVAPEMPARQRAPEAHQLHGAAKNAEQSIGHMLMAAEAVPLIAAGHRPELTETRPSKPAKQEVDEQLKKLTETRVETLNRAELLAISEKIIIDGSSLRQIYETHLIGEHGLRRLVREHLRGGDLKKALRREIVEREIDFERDPVLRDKIDPAKVTPTGGGAAPVAGQDALGKMIEKASAALPADTEQAAFYKAKANYEIEQRAKRDKRRNAVDALFGAVIAALVAAVAFIYLTRG